MPPSNRPDDFCSRRARAAGEPVFGTASRIDVWLLLAYPHAWAADAFAGSGLPDPVKRRLAGLLRPRPGWRLLFLKRAPRPTDPPVLYVAVSDELAPRLHRVPLLSYTDLLDLDLPALAADAPAYRDQRSEESLFLVCTHGTHDRCCAKFGLPVYQALAGHAPDATWQCSHVGGDRFAANLLCFPHGLYYGHVPPTEAGTIADEYRQGRVALEGYRGRPCYGFLQQAAEYQLRVHTGVRALPGFRYLGAQRTGPDRWAVRFATVPAGTTYRVHLTRETLPAPAYINCNATAPSEIAHYRLLDLAAEG